MKGFGLFVLFTIAAAHSHRATKEVIPTKEVHKLKQPTRIQAKRVTTTTVAPTAAAAIKNEEGLVHDTVSKFLGYGHDDQTSKHYTPKVDSKLCYEMISSDNPHINGVDVSFKDISISGQCLSNFTYSDNGYTQVQFLTSFPFFERYLSEPLVLVGTNGLISFDLNSADQGIESYTANLQSVFRGPYATIAGSFQDYEMKDVWLQTDEDCTTVQYLVEENTADPGLTGTFSEFQIRIKSSGEIIVAYNYMNCEAPKSICGQVGVKPFNEQLDEGYKTSMRKLQCREGQFVNARNGTSYLFRPAECSSLIGQTGIRKAKEYSQHKETKGDLFDKFYGEVAYWFDSVFKH